MQPVKMCKNFKRFSKFFFVYRNPFFIFSGKKSFSYLFSPLYEIFVTWLTTLLDGTNFSWMVGLWTRSSFVPSHHSLTWDWLTDMSWDLLLYFPKQKCKRRIDVLCIELPCCNRQLDCWESRKIKNSTETAMKKSHYVP